MALHRLVVAAVLVSPAHAELFNGHRRSEEPRTSVIRQPTGEELVEERSLPSSFDWRDVNGKNLVSVSFNQHIPAYCGSCWIHASVAVLNDRIKILRGGAFPDVLISRQALVNCVPGPNGTAPPGCDGGEMHKVFEFMHQHKVPDETCQAYKGVTDTCEPITVCQNCLPAEAVKQFHLDSQCWGMPSFTGYGVGDYGQVSGELGMMKEVYARGPIACGFVVQPALFVVNYSQNAAEHEGVFVSDVETTKEQMDHDVVVTGWGETPGGIKYWLVRNSWGTYWADQGWFKIVRGENSLQIEADCEWAVPTFEELNEALYSQRVLGDYLQGPRNFSHEALPAVGGPSETLATAALAAVPSTSPLVAAAAGALAVLAVLGVTSVARRRPGPVQHRSPLLVGSAESGCC